MIPNLDNAWYLMKFKNLCNNSNYPGGPFSSVGPYAVAQPACFHLALMDRVPLLNFLGRKRFSVVSSVNSWGEMTFHFGLRHWWLRMNCLWWSAVYTTHYRTVCPVFPSPLLIGRPINPLICEQIMYYANYLPFAGAILRGNITVVLFISCPDTHYNASAVSKVN